MSPIRHYYHGTTDVIETIDLSKSRFRTDFGKGFYLGTNLGIARDWAIDKTGIMGVPTVMRYVLDEVLFNDEKIGKLWFDEPTSEWLDFIRDNRRIVSSDAPLSAEPRHSHDFVFGPIANDKIADVVDEYLDGHITTEEAIHRVRVMPSVFQLSLHTPLALSFLRAAGFQQRRSGKWSAWTQ